MRRKTFIQYTVSDKAHTKFVCTPTYFSLPPECENLH